jgi:NTE family protein
MVTEVSRAIVLGGGGVTGIAWELGYLAGLEKAGVAIARTDLYVGTSAGATVAVQVTSGMPLQDIWRLQLTTHPPATSNAVSFDPDELVQVMWRLEEASCDRRALRREVGRRAAATRLVMSPSERRAMIAERLLAHEWPRTKLALVAVDVDSGTPRVFSRDSGVALVDAVTASSALPWIYPPARIDEHRYMDGALRSMENADLARGCTKVLVLQAISMPGVHALDEQVAMLERQQAWVHVARPDTESLAAIGADILNPSACANTALAAHAQGLADAPIIREQWN